MGKRNNLINARKSSGLTQEEVGKRVGLVKSSYCLIENGERDPSLDVINKLEDLFGIPQRTLLQK